MAFTDVNAYISVRLVENSLARMVWRVPYELHAMNAMKR